MSKLKDNLLLIGGLTAIFAVLAITYPSSIRQGSAGDGKGPQVLVVNTPAEPVPTTIEGGAVNAVVSAPVTVGNFPQTQNVAGTVNVGNLPAALVEPYFARASDSSLFGQFKVSFQVPEGKILRIEKVSLFLEFTSAPLEIVYTSTGMPLGPPTSIVGGNTAPPSRLVYIDGPFYEPGDFDITAIFGTGSTPERFCYFYVSGQLIPASP